MANLFSSILSVAGANLSLRKKLKLWADMGIIARSGFFDEKFYLERNQDVAASNRSALLHYARYGGFEGRNASKRFASGYYLKTNPDVRKAAIHPLVHYVLHGAAEGRCALPPKQSSSSSPKLPAKSVPKKSAKSVPKKLEQSWDTRLLLSVSWPTLEGITLRKLYIIASTRRERNTVRYRVNHLSEMASHLVDVEVTDVSSLSPSFYADIDAGDCAVVVQRLPIANKAIEEFYKRVNASASQLIFEIDDQIFDREELEAWRVEALEHPPESYLAAMKYANQFLVSTTALRNRIERMFKKPVHIASNCLSAAIMSASQLAKRPNYIPGGSFIIGYAAGSATHDSDLAAALAGVIRFLREIPASEFHCIGAVSLPEAMKAEFSERIVMLPSVNWRELPEVLGSFTVQIIPLEFCKFNKFKSHIRFLESAAVGVPVIASNIGEQAATIISGHTGILVENTEEAWFSALLSLHGDADFNNEIAWRANAVVASYWNTESKFRQERLKQILSDFGLGVLRDKISIILVTYNPLYDVKQAVESILNNTRVPFELLIWNNSSREDVKSYLASIDIPNCMIIDVGRNLGKAKGANHLFRIAGERFICGLDDDYAFPPSWDIRMLSAAKVVPNLGWLSTNLSADSSGMRGIGRIDSFNGGVSVFHADGVGGWVVFTSATTRERLGFYKEHGFYGGIDGDFNRRARRAGFYTGYVSNVVGRHKINRSQNAAWELFKQVIQDEMRIHGKDSDLVTRKFEDFFATNNRGLSISIKICTPLGHDENVWGDTHYARGLKSALEAFDYRVRIDKHEEWYPDEDAADIVIHLFGLHKFKPSPLKINILWVISHADLLDREFLESFDYIFCASQEVTKRAREVVPDVRVETLIQCTDSQVFSPDNSVVKDIDVAFVGNSRRVYRDAVRYALEMGLDVAIWGTKWENFIDKKYIRGQALSTEDVANVYRRAKVVLNDHWKDQKADGLVNNRIFDVLACGTMVLSDENPGLDSIFTGRTIPTFSDRASFEREISVLLGNEKNRIKLAEALATDVLNNHTFKQRAKAINDSILYIIENYVAYKSERNWAKKLADMG